VICGIVALSIYVIVYKIASPNLSKLPDFWASDQYDVKPYLAAAIALQSMGQQKAEAHMMKYAKPYPYPGGDSIFILCRMLYVKRPSSDFKLPGLGLPTYIGGTGPKDWSLEPIEVVHGVPFLITTSYGLYGAPPDPEEYLEYCMTNCNWNTFRYEHKSNSKLNSALNTILNSPKWKRPLREDEKEWLTAQIQ
jgi:hypothetical protein